MEAVELLDCVIPSNPDIAGIGVRIAIYVQNLLCFIPAIWAIWDADVSDYELESIETQSTTNLILAFSLLISCVVQAFTLGLTNYHASIVLSMSWTNNTNVFIYFLLYVQNKSQAGTGRNAVQPQWSAWLAHVKGLPRAFFRPFTRSNGVAEPDLESTILGGMANDTAQSEKKVKKSAAKVLFQRIALFLGSLHLTTMAALGLWLWSSPQTFGSPASSCVTEHASIAILGFPISFGSNPLRVISLAIYALFLLPGFNLLLPMAAFLSLFLWHHAQRRRLNSDQLGMASRSTSSTTLTLTRWRQTTKRLQGAYVWCLRSPVFPVCTGLAFLFLLNVALITDIELTLRRNIDLQEPGETEWGFGQVLAVLLLFMPLRDLVEMVLARRQRRQERQIREHEWKEALHLGDVDKIFALVKAGVDPNVETGDGQTALEIVTLAGNWDQVCDIVNAGADVNAEFQSAPYGTVLQSACAAGSENTVELLLEKGANTSAKGGKHGETSLHTACFHNKKEVVQTLLEHGVDPNITDDRGRTPLHAASKGEFVEVARNLLDSGANPNLLTLREETPLHTACWEKSQRFSRILLESGANPNLRTREKGFTPLHVACWRRSIETVRCLLEFGADPNIRGNSGESPVQLIQRLRPTKDLDIIDLLRQYGAAD